MSADAGTLDGGRAMPHRWGIGVAWAWIAKVFGAGAVAAGVHGAVVADTQPAAQQSTYMAMAGLVGLIVTQVFSELDKRRNHARLAADLEHEKKENRRLRRHVTLLMGRVADHEGQVDINAAKIGGLAGQVEGLRENLERSGFFRQARPPAVPMPDAKWPGLLLVEDDPDTARYLGGFLVSSGFDVDHAATVPEAIEGLSRRPAVVVLDLKLGKAGDGLDVLRKARDASAAVRVVVVTGAADPARIAEAQAAGADAILSKPVDPDELLRTLRAPAREHRP